MMMRAKMMMSENATKFSSFFVVFSLSVLFTSNSTVAVKPMFWLEYLLLLKHHIVVTSSSVLNFDCSHFNLPFREIC